MSLSLFFFLSLSPIFNPIFIFSLHFFRHFILFIFVHCTTLFYLFLFIVLLFSAYFFSYGLYCFILLFALPLLFIFCMYVLEGLPCNGNKCCAYLFIYLSFPPFLDLYRRCLQFNLHRLSSARGYLFCNSPDSVRISVSTMRLICHMRYDAKTKWVTD